MLVLMAPCHSEEYPSLALQMGPQFYHLWSDDECAILNRAITNNFALPWNLIVGGDKLKQQTINSIQQKCNAPSLLWETIHGEIKVHHIKLYVNEQILVGFVLSRYYCRDTHLGWGDDGSLDANEEIIKLDINSCYQFNMDSADMFDKVKMPSMRYNGGVTWMPTWYILDSMATIKGK